MWVLITIKTGPLAGHWLGYRDRYGREHLVNFKGELGHCISL